MNSQSHKILLEASALEGKFTAQDSADLDSMEAYFRSALVEFRNLDQASDPALSDRAKYRLIALYETMGKSMQEIVAREKGRIFVYSFLQPRESHGEASRLIAKLRDVS